MIEWFTRFATNIIICIMINKSFRPVIFYKLNINLSAHRCQSGFICSDNHAWALCVCLSGTLFMSLDNFMNNSSLLSFSLSFSSKQSQFLCFFIMMFSDVLMDLSCLWEPQMLSVQHVLCNPFIFAWYLYEYFLAAPFRLLKALHGSWEEFKLDQDVWNMLCLSCANNAIQQLSFFLPTPGVSLVCCEHLNQIFVAYYNAVLRGT